MYNKLVCLSLSDIYILALQRVRLYWPPPINTLLLASLSNVRQDLQWLIVTNTIPYITTVFSYSGKRFYTVCQREELFLFDAYDEEIGFCVSSCQLPGDIRNNTGRKGCQWGTGVGALKLFSLCNEIS